MDDAFQQKELEEIINYYGGLPKPSSQENTVSALREIQELLGCIPLDIQELLAERLDIKPVLISSLIKLYPSLTSAPRRHKITLCLGVQCSQKDAAVLEDALIKAISGRPFLLSTKNCLKHCRTAPNLQIGQDIYRGVRPEELETILKKYEKSEYEA